MNFRNLLSHPSYIISFANAVIALVLAFGIVLTVGQIAAILGVLNAGIIVLLALTDTVKSRASGN